MSLQSLDALVTIVMFGGLLLLAFIKLANPLRINRRGNFFLGILLLLWASFWLEEICELAGVVLMPVQFVWLLQWFQLFSPLSLYLSIRFYANPTYRFKWKDAKHLIVPTLFLVLVLLRYNDSESNHIAFLIFPVLMFLQTFFYLSLSYLKTKQHREKLVKYEASIQGRDLNWLDYIILQVLIISVIALVFTLLGRENPGLIMNSINLAVVFIVAYHSVGQKEIFHVHSKGDNFPDFIDESEEKRKMMSASDLNIQMERLTNLMSVQRYYLDSNLNLVKLANLLNLTPHQLSYVINTGFNVNFFQFVNQYRINKAKEYLINNTNNATILAIAYESGFNSKTAFNTTFKKITGYTPSGFMKQHSR